MKKTIGAFDKVRESAKRLEEAANMLIAHIDSMTAQHTPSQSVKQEPEYWEVSNGVCPHGVYRTKEQAEDVCFDMQKSHDLSGSLASFNVRPLYAAPVSAKREWADLTDYEIVRLYAESPMCDSEMIDFARAVIAAFKEKNK